MNHSETDVMNDVMVSCRTNGEETFNRRSLVWFASICDRVIGFRFKGLTNL